MTMTDAVGLPLIKAIPSDLFPLDLIDPGTGLGELLSRIIVTEASEEILPAGPDGGPGGRYEIGLSVEEEAVLDLVGLDGFALVLGGATATTLRVGAEMRSDRFKLLVGAGARLRFPRSVLKPVRRDGDPDTGPWVDDEARDFAELEINAGVTIDDHFDVEFDGSNAFVLEPAMIADSGLVIEGEVALDLSESSSLPESTALGLGPEWRGIVFKELTVHLPAAVTEAVPITSLSFEDFHIGSGGVTGTISLDNTTPAGEGALGGFPFIPRGLSVELRQNCLVRAELEGELTLSFFDAPLDITAGFDLDGNFTVAVSSSAAGSGIVELTKPDILTLALDGIAFALTDGVFSVAVSGTITPLIGGLDWPGFHVDELSIDSQGRVKLEGGWLNLPAQFGLDFYGFHVAITRLGMGSSDDGGKWIGFSGSVKLVDGLSIGGSVDGLRVTWYDDGRAPQLTCDGVGVELEIPDVLRFKGSISFHTIVTPDGRVQKRFDGDILLDLMVVGLRIDGQIVIGTDTGADGSSYTFFALYIGVELPAGIPLGATGLGLFGMAGLVAIQMAPNKGAQPNALHTDSRIDESWFENDDGTPGWFKRDPIGVVALRSKWDPIKDGFAVGGGITLGTVSDNGYMFAAKVLLVLSFPGPVIMIEGKANLAKERAKLSDDPIFRLLMVLDFRSGDLLAGMMAKYAYDDDGSLIAIAGSAEAYFNYNDPSRWHVYVGVKDPKTRRIRADILSIFEANTYLMIDGRSFQTGAWIGWDKRWDFGPVGVVLEVWIEGGAQLSWKPPHFNGYLWLHGNVSLKVFGFGLGLYVDAKVSADVFDPFEIVAEMTAGIDLPWPLPDFEVDLTLRWGPEPDVPPLPLALKEVAVEHFKATASWPLARGELMQPAVDAGDGFLALPVPAPNLAAGPPANAPVVPVDSRPHLTFGRPVHDDALIGVNPQPVHASAVPAGWERIGDPGANQGPMRVRYGLQEIVLSRWTGTTWVDVARKGPGANASGVAELYGSWAPVPALPSGTVAASTDPPVDQTKLWLWSRSPFDYTRHGNRTWDEWFTQRYQQYPCIPPVSERTVCCDADGLQAGGIAVLPMPYPAHPEVVVTGPGSGVVRRLEQAVDGHAQALRWDPAAAGSAGGDTLGVKVVGPPAKRMTLVFAPEPRRVERHCFDASVLVEDYVKLPVEIDGFGLRAFDAGGGERGDTAVRPLPAGGTAPAGERGIDIGYRAEVALPCPADSVEVTLWLSAGGCEIRLLDANGKVVSGEKSPADKGLVTVVVRGGGTATTAVILAPQNETLLVELCVDCGHAVPLTVDVIGVDEQGKDHGPFPLTDGTATVTVDRLQSVELRSSEAINLVEACVTYPPSDDELVERNEMARHLVDATARWSDTGEVLQPDTAYRLRTVTTVRAVGEGPLDGIDDTHPVTEVAWFRTEGPPALAQLSKPAHQPADQEFASGLDDLTRYVRQTVPATVPARGEQPTLPRPVFRADDVGVEFNEDYVDLMYRLARRDLRLQLTDANDQPIRDLAGRVVVADNRWGTTERLTLVESEQRYLTMIDRVACVSVDHDGIPRSRTLAAGHPDLVLAPDAVHQARLVPMLLHDDFRDGLTGWTKVDVGTVGGPAVWSTSAAGVTQTSSIRGNEPAGAIGLPGALLVGGDTAWTDLRATVALRTSTVTGSANSSIGLALRYQGPGNCYRFSIDRAAGRRRLVRFVGGVATLLAEDQLTMALDHDYEVTVEAVGAALRVSVDGTLVFDVTDQSGAPAVPASDGQPAVPAGPLAAGRLALCCAANPGARFTDVRVDDLRSVAPVAYRFSFTTSRFVDIHHLLHSFEDDVWTTPSPLAAPALATPLAAAVDLDAITPGSALAAVGDAERRAFTTLADGVLGAAARNLPTQLDVHRVTLGGAPIGLLVRSPEPLDWSRTTLAVTRAAGTVPADTSTRPGPVKLIGLAPGGDTADDEVVSLLTRSRLDLAGLAIETYGIVDAWPSADSAATLLLDGDTADWSDESDPDGTPIAIAGDVAWTDVVVTAAVRTDDEPLGLLVRYESVDDFVRFAVDPSDGGRRLVRCQDGVLTTLWEDAVPVVAGHAYELVVAAVGPSVRVWLDGVPLLEVDDHGGPAAGRVGLYGLLDADQFSAVGVFDALPLVVGDLFVDDFAAAVPDRWTIDTAGTQGGPAVWTVVDGELRQTSGVWGDVTPSNATHPAKPGTVAVCTEPDRLGPLGIVRGSATWADYRVAVRLRSDDDDAMGVVFRYVDADNWYRFSMDHGRSYRRLVRCVDGVIDELWSDGMAYEVGREHLVTIDAVGDALTGWVDGAEVFSVRDSSHPAGTIGLYCWANAGARFASVRVTGARWSTHHVFPTSTTPTDPATAPAGGGLVEAGTRVELHSSAAPGGGAAAAPPPVPGVVHRYVVGGAGAHRRLPTHRPVDVRLRDTVSGERGHARRFLPAAAYSAAGALRVLRKADGTEAFLFQPATGTGGPGAALAAGQLRLQVTYRRDVTAAVPGSPVRSRAGHTGDEHVTLDIPWTGG